MILPCGNASLKECSKSQSVSVGVTVRYTYDEFGRLSETIETGKRENVIQKNEYKYATEK